MSQRNLLIALFASLAVNLFVIGAVAGAYLFGAGLHGPRPPGPRGGPPMFAAAKALPDDQAEAYRDALSAEAIAVRPMLRQARQLRHDAWMKLSADPVDAAGIAADLDKARNLQAQAQSQVDRRIVEFAAGRPAGERGKMAEILANPPQRRGRGEREGGGPPPPQP